MVNIAQREIAAYSAAMSTDIVELIDLIQNRFKSQSLGGW